MPAGIIFPAFPQRSPPRLLTAAACGGLGSAPDRRTRRALLHLSYSCASPELMTMLVTHDPNRSSADDLLDHRVSDGEESFRYIEAEHSGGLQVGRLRNRA